MTDLGYLCAGCGERHDDLPFSYGSPAPVYWDDSLADEDGSVLDEEICILRGEHFFVRARLVIPVRDSDREFDWGVWVSLSRPSFARMLQVWDSPERDREPASFGWLSTELAPVYPVSTVNLKTNLHTERPGVRPHIQLEPTDHPLAVEQREGITVERVRRIAAQVLHPAP